MELFESSPRLAARDGMEQEPYEFRSCPASIALRSSSIPGSKGKERAASRLSLRTHGKIRTHAFPGFKKHQRAQTARTEVRSLCSRDRLPRAKFCWFCIRTEGEQWATRKISSGKLPPDISTTPNRSKSSA